MFISTKNAEQIVLELKAIIGHDVNIMSKDGIIIASSDPCRVGSMHRVAKSIIEHQLTQRLVLPDDITEGVREGVNLPIEVNGVCEGVIGITGPVEEVGNLGKVAKKMTEILLTALQTQEQENYLERSRNLFFEEVLFSPYPDWPELNSRGDLLGISFTAPKRLALLEIADRAKSSEFEMKTMKSLNQHIKRFPSAFTAILNQRLFLLFESASLHNMLSTLRSVKEGIQAEYSTSVSVGISQPADSMEELRRCYSEAKISLCVATQNVGICEYNNKSIDFVVKSIDNKVQRDFLNAMIPPMPDKERKELFEFLRIYFYYNGNIEKISQSMTMHTNTVRYRIGRIEKLTGLDMRIPRDLAALYLALQFELSTNER